METNLKEYIDKLIDIETELKELSITDTSEQLYILGSVIDRLVNLAY